MLVAWLPQLICGKWDQNKNIYGAQNLVAWLSGQKDWYRANDGCLIALADIWKLGQKKECIWRAKRGCLVALAYL